MAILCRCPICWAENILTNIDQHCSECGTALVYQAELETVNDKEDSNGE